MAQLRWIETADGRRTLEVKPEGEENWRKINLIEPVLLEEMKNDPTIPTEKRLNA